MNDIDLKILEEAESLFRKQCNFIMGAAKTEQLPDYELPEIAFAGRSNVGKSSLINALLNRKRLARTSKTPGRTQEINFFNLIDKLLIVDLPGYGYAKVSRSTKNSWNKTIRLYLKGRAQLKRVFLLVDSRHGIKEVDNSIMDLLDEAAVSYQIVLTKIDKIKGSDLDILIKDTEIKLAKKHPASHPIILASSSEKNLGLENIKVEAASFLT